MKNKIKAFISLILCFVLLISVTPATFAANNTSAALAQPLSVQITTNKSSYSNTSFAKISVTITNTCSDTLNDVTVENILPNTVMIFGTDHLTLKANSLAPGGNATTTFEACLNPDKANINSFNKFFYNMKVSLKKLFNPKTALGTGIAQIDPSVYSFAFDTAKELKFGQISAVQTVRVSYKIAGLLQGNVTDALTGAKIASADVTTYRTSSTPVDYEKISKTTTDSAGNFKLILVAGSYSVTVTKAGYVAVIQYSVKVTVDKATNLTAFKLVPGVITTYGTAGGAIKDSAAGNTLANVTIKFRTGLNSVSGGYFKNASGTEITVTTNDSGVYSVTLPLGNYTAELIKSGYTTGHMSIFSSNSGTARNEQNGSLTPAS